MEAVKITLTGSFAGTPAKQRATLRCLGLTRRHQSVVRALGAGVEGQLKQVAHLVKVESTKGSEG